LGSSISTEVREAVGTVTPDLLARWDTEPTAIQLALAALAAAFPEHAGLITPRIRRMASEQADTRVGAYALLASRLVARDGAAALAIAREIDFWDSQLLRVDIDNELTSPQLRALHVLTEAVLNAAGAVRA